jgi:hypothetical protein
VPEAAGAGAVEDIGLAERDLASPPIESDRHGRARGPGLKLRHLRSERRGRAVGGKALDVNALLVDVAVEQCAFRGFHHRPWPADEPGVDARRISDQRSDRLIAARAVEDAVEQVYVALFLARILD